MTINRLYFLPSGNAVNLDFCESIRRIVEGIIVRTECTMDEAIAESAIGLDISEDAVKLAIAVTNEASL